ncbi:MAG: hypothetical protein J6J42_13920 [Lachnospiraceae bacterium]|nr:hypothetical protein [Lachnospiraceae bacterium]
MNTTFIQGQEEIIHHFGYFPDFHDDYLEHIEISSQDIILSIRMASSAEQEEVNEVPSRYVTLTLHNIKNFNLQGNDIYGVLSILFDIRITKTPDGVLTKLSTSLGAEGSILSESAEVKLL